MTEPVLCPQCGSEIPAGSPAGLCPKCLVTDGLESRPPAAWLPQWTAILRRRATVLALGLITLAVAAFLGLQAGYLAGADWYFKREMPYDWLVSAWTWLFWAELACLWWLWYLLAKAPDTPPGFGEFFRVMQGNPPNPRTKRLGLPAGVFFVVWIVAEVIAMTTLGDSGQAIVNSIPYVVGPYLAVAALWWAYRPRPGETPSQPASVAKAAVPAAPPAATPTPVALPQMLGVAIGLVLGLFLATIGLLLIPAAFMFANASPGLFGGLLGSAVGCLGGGLGSLAGSWNTYRQYRGQTDWMKMTRWTGFDSALAVYGVFGLALLLGGAFAKVGMDPTAESAAITSSSIGAVLWLGGLVLFQAALFLMFRMPLIVSQMSESALGRVSLRAAITGMILPVLLVVAGTKFLFALHLTTDRFNVCAIAGIVAGVILGSVLELVAMGFGIAGRRTGSGKAGLILVVLYWLLVVLIFLSLGKYRHDPGTAWGPHAPIGQSLQGGQGSSRRVG